MVVNGPLVAYPTLIAHQVVGSFLVPVLARKHIPSFFGTLDGATILIKEFFGAFFAGFY